MIIILIAISTFLLLYKKNSKSVEKYAYQSEKNQKFSKCECIHIGLVCAGYESSRYIVTLFKSILFYRRNPIHFHLLVDEKASRTLNTLLISWALPSVNISFYTIEKHLPEVQWIPNVHYSGVFGLLKLIFPSVLPNEIDRIIFLDTDVLFTTDISELWHEFLKFKTGQIIGLVENQSDFYLRKLFHNYQPWPALNRGFNTGVMLMKIREANKKNWYKIWNAVTIKYLSKYKGTVLADQDIINAVIKENPDLLYQLNCQWNIQLSDHTDSYRCYTDESDVKVIHWNSPRKLKVKNLHSDYFRSLYQTFVEYNGNLLRDKIFYCNKSFKTSEKTPVNDQCSDFKKVQNSTWRTHLFILDYEYEPNISGCDVTLIAQLSIDRLAIAEQLTTYWNGPISLTLYLSDAEVVQFFDHISSSNILKFRKNIAYHVVYKDGDYYPINFLRNIGLQNINTPYVFLSDADFLPMMGLYETIKDYIAFLDLKNSKKALLIPAFETQRYRIGFPKNKYELLSKLDQSILFTFRNHVWTKGHAATNYSKWRTAIVPYKVNWEPDFEPYLVTSKDIPLYDTRFVGFGWNKVSHIMELNAIGYEFIVLPNAFIIHVPHAPSLDIAKFRTSSHYRICLKAFKEEFIRHLNEKYNNVYNASIFEI